MYCVVHMAQACADLKAYIFLSSEIYPYVVIIIGLENILIVVKAVISTPEELEVGVVRLVQLVYCTAARNKHCQYHIQYSTCMY